MKRLVHNSTKYGGKRKFKNPSQQLGYDLAGHIIQKYQKAMKVLAK